MAGFNLLFLDATLTPRVVISSFESFEFTQKYNSVGSFTLRLNNLTRQALGIQNHYIMYYQPDKVGLVTRVETIKENDSEYLTISGIELKDIIGCRITEPYTGDENTSFVNKTTEYIVRNLIDKYLISNTDTRKNINFIQLGANTDLGTEKDFSTRNKNLRDEVYDLLYEELLGLKCVINLETKLATFSVYQGLNRTAEQNVNPRAIFEIAKGTLKNINIDEDYSIYRNVAYVGGQGKGVARTIIELPGSNVESGLNRWELFVDARDVDTNDELTTRGLTQLAKYSDKYILDGDVYNASNLKYGVGDIVTIVDNDVSQNLQIISRALKFVRDSEPKISINFGDEAINFADAVNAATAGIKNILTD